MALKRLTLFLGFFSMMTNCFHAQDTNWGHADTINCKSPLKRMERLYVEKNYTQVIHIYDSIANILDDTYPCNMLPEFRTLNIKAHYQRALAAEKSRDFLQAFIDFDRVLDAPDDILPELPEMQQEAWRHIIQGQTELYAETYKKMERLYQKGDIKSLTESIRYFEAIENHHYLDYEKWQSYPSLCDLYVWSLRRHADLVADLPEQNIEDNIAIAKTFEKSQSYTGFSQLSDTSCQIAIESCLALAKYYTDIAHALYKIVFTGVEINNDTSFNRLIQDPDWPNNYERLSSYFDAATYFYILADIKLNSIEAIHNTDFMEWIYIAQGDTSAYYKRENEIGKFFYNNRRMLYPGLNNMIEIPILGKTIWITTPYAAYPMFWLMRQGDFKKRNGDIEGAKSFYEKALVFYDSISTRFCHDNVLLTNQFLCLQELGYWGDGFINALRHTRNTGNLYSEYEFSSIDLDLYNGRTYYINGQYLEAIYYFDKYLSKETTPYGLLMRGVCYHNMAQKAVSDNKRNEYSEKALTDFNAALENEKTSDGDKAFILALLGNKNLALKLAEPFYLQLDTLIEYNFYHNGEDSLKAAYNHLYLAQIYSMTGHIEEAIKSVDAMQRFSHDPMLLSEAKVLPYMETVWKKLPNFFEQNLELNSLEIDTNIAFLEYHTSNGVMKVSCTLNGITDSLIFDSGSGHVQISNQMAKQMIANGTLKMSEDSVTTMTYICANGSSEVRPVVLLRTVEIGGIVLHDVTASITKQDTAPLLLGMSVLDNFSIELNPRDHLLTLKQVRYRRQPLQTTNHQTPSFNFTLPTPTTCLQSSPQADRTIQTLGANIRVTFMLSPADWLRANYRQEMDSTLSLAILQAGQEKFDTVGTFFSRLKSALNLSEHALITQYPTLYNLEYEWELMEEKKQMLQNICLRLEQILGHDNINWPQNVPGTDLYTIDLRHVRDTNIIKELITTPGKLEINFANADLNPKDGSPLFDGTAIGKTKITGDTIKITLKNRFFSLRRIFEEYPEEELVSYLDGKPILLSITKKENDSFLIISPNSHGTSSYATEAYDFLLILSNAQEANDLANLVGHPLVKGIKVVSIKKIK